MNSTIYISLRDEGTDVWRPVSAQQVRGDVYRITGTRADDTESWEFTTGDIVRCREQRFSTGESGLAAYERVAE